MGVDHLMPTAAVGPTMSSREIAELVDVRHDNVRRTIERLAEKGAVQLPPTEEVRNHLGQAVTEYRVGKRDSYVIVAQLSPEFTARLVDRWQELETGAALTPARMLDDPAALRAALLGYTEKVIALEAAKVELERRVEDISPKAAIYDRFLNADGLIGLQDLGRVLGQKPNKFIERLKPRYLFDQGGVPTPRQEFVDRGIFRVTSVLVVDKIRKRTWVTAKGVQYFAKKLNAEPLRNAA